MARITYRRGNAYAVTYTGGRVTVLYSYSTAVVVHIEGRGYFVTDTWHSATTTRHISQYLAACRVYSRATVTQEALDKVANAPGEVAESVIDSGLSS